MSGRHIGPLTLRVHVERWPLVSPFRISSHTTVERNAIVVELGHEGTVGRGEAGGIFYLGDKVATMLPQIESVRAAIEAGIDRARLQHLLPPGGARNAVDCALWELESKLSQRPVWQLAGLAPPRPLVTTLGCGAESPEVMAATAARYPAARAVKLKLTGDEIDAERVRVVREAVPDVWLGVDANQGFTLESLQSLLPTLVAARVQLVEQPFPVGQERWLEGLECPIPIAADESVQSLEELEHLARGFQVVNIKLDKCGGMTEALAMARRIRELGLEAMVGNMIGTSLAMAPAFLVGQLCTIADLDGPIFLKSDRADAVEFRDGMIHCPPAVWGFAG
jgi:L-alanine-DL-glutamate epimerase-like enolase superfamily enzyme